MPQPFPPILLIGAGRMGGALYQGWQRAGLAASVLIDPALPANLARPQDQLHASLAGLPPDFAPEAVLLAIKPQMAEQVLPALGQALTGRPVLLSILAGKPIAALASLLGRDFPIVRAMPNTPAAIGQGMTVAHAAPGVTPAQRALCHDLLACVGEVAWLDGEELIDPISAISGSGPAYVFLLAELLEQAALGQEVPPTLARTLARRTVAGAGALLAHAPDESAALRQAVTSPKGITERALSVLMAPEAWPALIPRAVAAAIERARELGK